MKNLRLTSDKIAEAMLVHSPKEVTDVMLYQDNGWRVFIVYKGMIFQRPFRWSIKDVNEGKVPVDELFSRVYNTVYLSYMDSAVEKRSNNSVN